MDIIWDTFLTKAEVLMKDNLTFIKKFVKVCGEVIWGTSGNI